MPDTKRKPRPIAVIDAKFMAEARTIDALPPPVYAQIAFAGRSNVGKSSLINTLVQRKKLVRTSQTPGCTRGINFFRIRFHEAELDFVDLPGYGYAQRSKAERRVWGELIEHFLVERPGLRAVVIIVDVRRGLGEEERDLLAFLQAHDRPAILVATKLDKLAPGKRKGAVLAIERDAGQRIFGFSAQDGEGREPLLRHLLKLAAIDAATSTEAE